MPTKSIFASTTFWASIITASSLLFPSVFAKLGLTGTDSSTIAAHIVTVIGTALTIWGRFHATTKVTLTGK